MLLREKRHLRPGHRSPAASPMVDRQFRSVTNRKIIAKAPRMRKRQTLRPSANFSTLGSLSIGLLRPLPSRGRLSGVSVLGAAIYAMRFFYGQHGGELGFPPQTLVRQGGIGRHHLSLVTGTGRAGRAWRQSTSCYAGRLFCQTELSKMQRLLWDWSVSGRLDTPWAGRYAY